MLKLRALSDTIGFEVESLDLSAEQPQEVRDALNAAFDENGLLLFRRQSLGKRELVSATRIFGEADIHPRREITDLEVPEIIIVSTHGARDDIEPESEDELVGDISWHTDLGYVPTPSRGALLQAVELPPEGGLTGFIDRQRAYADLPASARAELDGLGIIQSWTHHQSKISNNPTMKKADGTPADDLDRYPDLVYPLVYRHPRNGHPILNIAPQWAAGLVGLPREVGDALLCELTAHLLQPRYQYWHRYEPGDVIMWDNWRLVHAASGTRGRYRRVMHRTTLRGDVQLGRLLEPQEALHA